MISYLIGSAALVAAVGALALGAARVRQRLLPGWIGLPARLADSVITVALLIWAAQLVGIFGLLGPLSLTAVGVVTGFGLRLGIGPAPRSPDREPPPAPPVSRSGVLAAAAIGIALLAHWSVGVSESLHQGMTGYDSAWYHMPFAAHFAQTGSTLDFSYVSPRYLAWFYPANSELLHGIAIAYLHSDLLSPPFNLVWLVGCLLAAWCIGRPYGLGPWTVAAVAVLLDAGVMADQAGEARNDTLGLFMLLAAVALIVNGAAARGERRIGYGPLAVAGLAAGLAAGTKLSFIAPVAVLVLGVPAFTAAGRRRAVALAFAGPVVAGCGFWYLRNLAQAGNPLPWFRAIGPLRLDGPEQGLGGRPQFSVTHYFGDGRVWSDWFAPGLVHRLGEVWPVLAGAVLLAVVLCLWRGPWSLRLTALAAVAGFTIYLLDGTSAEGPPGTPLGFASSLRHLVPALGLGLVLLPLSPGLRSQRGRAGVALLFAALLVAADRSGNTWRPWAVLTAVAGAAIAYVIVFDRRLRLQLPRRRSFALAAIAGSLALVIGGWFAQRSYVSDRYTGPDFRSKGLNAAFAWASAQRSQRIATTLPLQYPLLGADLSNRVSFVGSHHADAGFTSVHRCGPLRRALRAGRYRFVVTAGGPRGSNRGHLRCLAREPGSRIVVRRDRVAVFRLLPARAERRPQAAPKGEVPRNGHS